MCVAAIISKPLTKHEIQLMHDSNPHGLGVGWLDQETKLLKYSKGLKPAEVFAMQEDGTLTYPYMFHARWATHGPRVAELCHPFPLGIGALFDTPQGESESLMIHNGVWYAYEKWVPDWLPKDVVDQLSDTAVAAYVAEFFPEIIEEISWAVAVARVNDKGEVEFTYKGNWQSHLGNKFSNLQWLPVTRSYSDYHSTPAWWETWRGKAWTEWRDGRKTTHLVAKPDSGRSRLLSTGEIVPAMPGPYQDRDMPDLGAEWESEADYSHLWDDTEDDKLDRQEFGSFEEWCEYKYGPEIAQLAMIIDPTGEQLSNAELESLAMSEGIDICETDHPQDDDMVTEDFQTVNEYLKKLG